MPQAYVQKMAKKHGLSVGEAEKIWDRAKKASNDSENFAIVTHIFQNMIGEKAKAAATPTAKQLLYAFESVARRGIEFSLSAGFVNLDPSDNVPNLWPRLDSVLVDPKRYEIVGVQLLQFKPKGPSIEVWVNYEIYQKEERVLKATVPAKGFLRDRLIKKLGLFDPAKIKQLAK
jgi:hypothetical protein